MRIDLIYEQVVGKKSYMIRPLDLVEGIMIHRVGKDRATGVDFGDTAEDICKAFTEGPAGAYTGNKIPYTFIIQGDARIAQTLPLSWVGPHALSLSSKFVSVALIGDFRAFKDYQGVESADEPSDDQFCSSVFLLRALLGVLCRPVTAIVGHTDPDMVKRGSTRIQSKRCPGEGLDLYKLRSAVSGGFAL